MEALGRFFDEEESVVISVECTTIPIIRVVKFGEIYRIGWTLHLRSIEWLSFIFENRCFSDVGQNHHLFFYIFHHNVLKQNEIQLMTNVCTPF